MKLGPRLFSNFDKQDVYYDLCLHLREVKSRVNPPFVNGRFLSKYFRYDIVVQKCNFIMIKKKETNENNHIILNLLP